MTSLRSSRLHPFLFYPRSSANGKICSWIICASRWLTSQRTKHANHLISFNSVSQSAARRRCITSQSRPSIHTVRCQRSLPLPAFIRSSLFLNPAAMAEQQQFYLLLSNLMSPDNTVRKQSEVWESFRDRFVCECVKGNVTYSSRARFAVLARAPQPRSGPAHVWSARCCYAAPIPFRESILFNKSIYYYESSLNISKCCSLMFGYIINISIDLNLVFLFLNLTILCVLGIKQLYKLSL